MAEPNINLKGGIMISQKRNIITASLILIIFVGSIVGYGIMDANPGKNSKDIKKTPTGSFLGLPEYPDDITTMFLCPCCGQALDRKNICCGMASDMIAYIDFWDSAYEKR